jgi:hypothetical protein
MILKVFWKQACPRCPAAKELAKDLAGQGVKVEYHNIDEVDGLAEATFFDVMATPSLVLVDDKNQEVVSWRGQVPDQEEVKKHFR